MLDKQVNEETFFFKYQRFFNEIYMMIIRKLFNLMPHEPTQELPAYKRASRNHTETYLKLSTYILS